MNETPSRVRYMDLSKRKRSAADEFRLFRPSQPSSAEGHPRVTDDEIEELFSIVRRMRDSKRSTAAATAATGGGNLLAAVRGHLAAAEPRWTPAFALEDFVGPGIVQDGGDRSDSAAEERAAVPRCLDLNADPEPEGLAELTPYSENTTASFARAPT